MAEFHYLYDGLAAQAHKFLHEHAHQVTLPQWGERKSSPLAIVKWGEAGMVGAACGVVQPGWLCIELLWVEEAFRGKNIGTELLEKIEEDAARMGAHSAYVWTQEYEAPDFYRKYGYAEFAQLDEFMKGHQLIGLRKKLANKHATQGQ